MVKPLCLLHGACLGLSRWVPKGLPSPGFDGGCLILGGCTAPTVGLSGSPPTSWPSTGQGLAREGLINNPPEVHGALRSQPPPTTPTTYRFPGISLGKGRSETCRYLFLMPFALSLMNALQMNNQHVP